MFGPRQVGEIIIGNSAAAQATVTAFIASAADKAIQIFSSDGTAVVAKKSFKAYQKTAGDAAKNLNFEFSDTIEPRYVERVTCQPYAVEVQKVVTYTVGTATPDVTYEAEIRLYNDGGTLSPENFAVIGGYYVSATGDTTTTIKDGLVLSLQRNLIKRGNSELTVVSTGAATFTVTGKFQTPVPGKIIGKQIEFDALAKSFSNAYSLTTLSQNLGLMTVVTTTAASAGMGTGKHAINYEWFVKGMKYSPERAVGYPADFDTPYYASLAGLYNVINVIYYGQRNETAVERQYKVLSIYVDKVTDVPANNAATNTILTAIRTAVDTYATVPANLAIV
jgi:hypothetical protein